MKFVKKQDGGDWLFHFIHSVTKKIATLEIHGFTNKQCKEFMFMPRIYWNGSSSGIPEISDWLGKDFNYQIKYYRK
jgi:hypothetical protein